MDRKTYLGDGVYARVDNLGGIELTTENGIRATNTIYLEGAVLLAFERWVRGLRAEAARAAAGDNS
jgi:hypothetical protein